MKVTNAYGHTISAHAYDGGVVYIGRLDAMSSVGAYVTPDEAVRIAEGLLSAARKAREEGL